MSGTVPDADPAALARAATDVLIANWTGGYTVPSRTMYPHQWSWDSAFIAIGLRHLSPRRAQRELESLFGAQWGDGRVPHIVFDPTTPLDAYFPGADFWRSAAHPDAPPVATTGLIQPPVHALAVWETWLAGPAEARRRGFLERMYPRLLAWHAYLTRCRTAGPGGTAEPHGDLVAIVHPWESGMDNSPSWDGPLNLVEPVPPTRFRRRDLQHAAAADRPTDVDYGRYVRLAADYRDGGYADRLESLEFAVLDPMTNALLAASETALAGIAAQVGADPGPHHARAARITCALVSELYDPAEGLFFPRDLRAGGLIRDRTVAGLIPLLLHDLPVAREILDTALGAAAEPGARTAARPGAEPGTGAGAAFRLGHSVLVPSYDLAGPAFEPSRYWRGPAWFNTTWLLWRGLVTHSHHEHADRLRGSMLATARREGFREYVDPRTGQGHGVTDFGWTAALVLDLLHDRDAAETPSDNVTSAGN